MANSSSIRQPKSPKSVRVTKTISTVVVAPRSAHSDFKPLPLLDPFLADPLAYHVVSHARLSAKEDIAAD